MVLKPHQAAIETWRWVEKDVKMYGTQTECEEDTELTKFENDVKMYGTQTPVSAG